MLKFKNAPDYEIKRWTDTTDNTPDTDYRQYPTVSTKSPFGSATAAAAGTHAMKVDVQDVEEDGMIMLSPLQPQVGTPLSSGDHRT